MQAQTQTNKTLSLSLQQVVEMSVEHNLDVQISRYQPLIDEFTLSQDYAVYEPAFNSSVQRAWQTNAGSVSPTGIINVGQRSDDSTAQANIGSASGGPGVTPWGMRYQLSTSVDKTTFFRTNFADQAKSQAQINLTQPLLRNAWIDSYRRDILIGKKTIKYDELGFRLQALNIVAQTEQAYYELIYDFENVKVQQAAVELAAQQAQEDRKRVEVGAMAPLDEKQTESQLASSRAALFQAQQTLGTQQNTLKGLITDKYREIYNVTIVPAEKLVAVP
ncbi:MAG: TolC family protein, partial [Limisphaerales bacterium]